MPTENYDLRLVSSLIKVFADEAPKDLLCRASMLGNEAYSFQVAYSCALNIKKNIQVRIKSELHSWITIRAVGLVPSELPCYAGHDDNVLRTTPGLYPDALLPIGSEGITFIPAQWRSLWVTIDPAGQAKAGIYPIEIIFWEQTGEELCKTEFHIEVLDALLPRQKLIHTEWFHTDCLATYYGVEVFSERHWELIGQFVDTAVKHGMNMILTPVFTPPLDTAVGGERPTVQLVDVQRSGNRYCFDFSKLKRWVELCRSKGMEYFEFSHLFTQWGAKHAPKIIATENGELKRIFGWETDAGGEGYRGFLQQFLPQLIKFIEENSLEKHSYFHISDEPNMEHLDDYIKAGNTVSEQLKGYPIIDALSDYKFYETGAVKNPIPSTDHIDAFLEHKVPDLWTYHCCGQFNAVANRFFNMPSARNRILGVQLYKFNIKGFLHWGYNFWYSQFSRRPIDPFRVTDADYAFPSGDAFLVYPGENEPIESIRLEILNEALQDLRALELLEGCIGKEAVLSMLEEGLEHPITFKEYPKEADWILVKREQINTMITRVMR